MVCLSKPIILRNDNDKNKVVKKVVRKSYREIQMEKEKEAKRNAMKLKKATMRL